MQFTSSDTNLALLSPLRILGCHPLHGLPSLQEHQGVPASRLHLEENIHTLTVSVCWADTGTTLGRSLKQIIWLEIWDNMADDLESFS